MTSTMAEAEGAAICRAPGAAAAAGAFDGGREKALESLRIYVGAQTNAALGEADATAVRRILGGD